MRLGSVVATTLVALLAAASPAGADCNGPTIKYDAGTIDRGDTITIHGTTWGDRCYDTGPPPKGEKTLGLPVQGIEIVFVQNAEFVVAQGAASPDFAFEVDVVVPADLEPGAVQLVARSSEGQAFDAADGSLVISDRPSAGTTSRVVSFGPSTPVTRDPEAVAPAVQLPEEQGRTSWVAPGLAAAILLGFLLVNLRRRYR